MSCPLEVVGLVKRFGDVTALSGVDLRLEEGSIHGLLGPNGAGKSTLLRILFGLVRPDDGTVVLLGRHRDANGPGVALQGVGGFVDRPHFYPYLSARRTLQLLAAADGLGAEAGIDAVLATVGLAEVGARRVAGWSTGMLQRLGIAAALLRRPRLLILDEPTEGLDPSGTRDLLVLVRSLAGEGVTVLFSSHDMAEVDGICDEVTILYRGRVARSAPLAELRAEAPVGRHRLLTSDDGAAQAVAARRGVVLQRQQRGGFSLQVGPSDLHGLVCELGRSEVSVQLLEQEVAPLTALFYSLTDDADRLAAAL